jgi:hypothetical protein
MKILPVGTELFHANRRADRETDRHDENNGRFSQIFEHAQQDTDTPLRSFIVSTAKLKEATDFSFINMCPS